LRDINKPTSEITDDEEKKLINDFTQEMMKVPFVFFLKKDF
jgi:hypothetical protein